MSGALALDWSPLLPWFVLAVLAALAAPIVALALWRRSRGVWWRIALVAVLLVTLGNPSLVREQREGLNDIALLLVDESPSQAIVPRGTQTRDAVAHLSEAMAALPNTELRVLRAGAATLGPDQQGTRLFSAVRGAPQFRAKTLDGVKHWVTVRHVGHVRRKLSTA